MMETWVLIPPELSLVLQPPSQQARVWTRVPVAQGRRWSPFQGTVRLGVMPSTGSSAEADEVNKKSNSCRSINLRRDGPMAAIVLVYGMEFRQQQKLFFLF